MGITLHRDVTYACVEGPRLGTRAESLFMRQVGCQLVGMTNVPEVFLAREAQICYATVCIATDYDCWMDDPAMHVSVGAHLRPSTARAWSARVRCSMRCWPGRCPRRSPRSAARCSSRC